MKETATFLLCCGAALLATGGTINNNSTAELGTLNGPVPGVKFEHIQIARDVTRANPERIYYPVTVNGGNPGKCMMLPGYRGLRSYRFSLEDFYIREACEVEISFDAKAGANEDGKYTPNQLFRVDFRANTDGDRDKYYPMLKGFTFRPSDKWQRFSKRFKIKGYTNFYSIWVMPGAGKNVNTLYLDNFRFARVGAPAKPQEEYSVTFDKIESLYRSGEPVKMTFRALLDTQEKELRGTVGIRFFHDGKQVAELPVALTRQTDGVYEGTALWKPDLHGAFAVYLNLKGRTPERIGGDFAIIHDPVQHPRFSPGWALGSNTENGIRFYAVDVLDTTFICLAGGVEKTFRDMRLSGQSIGRVWGHWRATEPEPGKFSKNPLDDTIRMMKKHRIEPVFCLVGSFNTRPDIQQVLKKGQHGFPAHLAKWHTVTKDNRDAVLMIPVKGVYDRYLDFVLNTWKDDVRIWEMSNEPGLLIRPPDGHAKWFIDLCKYTYETIKKTQPDSIVLGNGVTGDFGMNIVGWCNQLNRENPDYVNWLDGVAFHPYNCGLDYMNGMYFRYRDVVRDISKTLKVKKPLWNTENYYLATAYGKQINYYLNKERFGANEVARQFLDGFLNGVKATMANTTTAFYRQVNVNGLAAPNDVFAATNALSVLLKEMDNVRELPLSQWVRAGMFLSRDGKKALGFLYDMRPSGSTWIPGKAAAQVLDIYGNPVNQKEYTLKFEPYYVTGTPAGVRELLEKSQFRLQNPVEVRARRFGETVFFEGKNLTGLPIEIEAETGSLPVSFSFRQDPRLSTVAVDGFNGSLKNIPLIPDTPQYRLPAKLKLENGSAMNVSFDGKMLIVEAEVKDPQVRPGKVFHEGSCVELFIDDQPFRNLARNAVHPLQFYGTPDGGRGVLKGGKRRDVPFEFKQEKTQSGWRAEFRIPVQKEYIGMDLIVTRGDGEKERISGIQRGTSYKDRFHYPLFKLGRREFLKNGSFEQSRFGAPDHWFYSVRNGSSFLCAENCGRSGKGMMVEVVGEQSAPSVIHQRAEFPAGKYRKGTLSFTAKLENVKTSAEGKGKHGLSIRFVMNRHGENYAEKYLKKDITGTSGWKLYQIPVELKNNTDFLDVELGLEAASTGKVFFDDIKLELE